MDARIEALADMIKSSLQKLTKDAEVKSYLDGYKVVSVMGVDEVKVRIAEPQKPRKVRKPISKEIVEKVKEVKKNFKDNLNVSNFLVLLVRVKEELNRMNVTKMSKEKRRFIALAIEDVFDNVNIKLLEAKENGKDKKE